MRLFFVNLFIVLFIQLLTAQDYLFENITTGNSPLPSDNLHSLFLDGYGVLWIGSDSGLTGFDGSNWIIYNTSNTDSLAANQINDIFLTNGQNLMLAGPSGVSSGTLFSADQIDWVTPFNTLNSGLTSDSVYALMADSMNSIWFATENGISVSADLGHWQTYAPPVVVPVIAVNKQAGTWQHFGTEGFGVLRLRYDGVDAITTASFLLAPYNLISDTVQATLVDRNGDRWYGTPHGLSYHTGDNSKVYTVYNADSGLVANNVKTLAEDANGTVWIGTNSGVSRFYDHSWLNFTETEGLVANDVNDIATASGNVIWFATSGGLSRLTMGSSALHDTHQPVVTDFRVSPAYPNPFNLSTHIDIEVFSPSEVTIKIYDIRGRLVRALLYHMLLPGRYNILWDGRNDHSTVQASGVYHAVIATADQSKVVKMILLK